MEWRTGAKNGKRPLEIGRQPGVPDLPDIKGKFVYVGQSDNLFPVYVSADKQNAAAGTGPGDDLI